MPKAERQQPLHIQISDHYAGLIAAGQLQPGDRLPTMAEIAGEWGVSHQTAVRAVEWLRSARLVTTTPREGSFVAGRRLVTGPQQRLTGTAFPARESAEVTAAELIRAPSYVVPILGLAEVKPGEWHVIRREQVSYEAGGRPFMLSVSWFPAGLAELVPELVTREPLDEPGGAGVLIGERTGRRVTHGRISREARLIKPDGREGPLLRLEPLSPVLAEVYVWFSGEDTIEYGEYCLIPGRVTENEFTL
jgi:GntR family transcriptional regulator